MNKKSVLYAESWNVAFRKACPGSIIEERGKEFNIIKNPVRYWAADPFLFEYDGDTYIFAEMYDYIRRRGGIGYCKISDTNNPKWKPIIFEKYHLSYPYIFEKDGEVFIMPESGASESLYLYKAVSFPEKWEKFTVLREGLKLADTTLIEPFDDNKALTYNVKDPNKPVLMLLDISNPKRDIELRLDNVEMRRPAGRVLPNGIRPAQNCAEDYGKGLVFYKYFSNEDYYEEEICRIFPEDLSYAQKVFLDGMHTYNYSTQYEVIDIKTRRFNLLNLLFRTIGKL